MATLVQFEKANSDGSKYFLVVGDESFRYIKVKSYSYGWANVIPLPAEYINDFAEIIEGCFERSSNFHKELNKAYGKNSSFKGIEFKFNDVFIRVTKKNSSKEEIIKMYREGAKSKNKSAD